LEIKKDTPLEDIKKLGHPCSCKACTVGCKHGSGVFSDEQLPKIAKFLKVDEKKLKEKYLEEIEKFNTKKFRPKINRKDNLPYGKCAFFDEKKGCTIHQAKPLECEIAMGCKDYGEEISIWFMLNQFVNNEDKISMKEYESYIKTGGKVIPGASLEEIKND